MIGFVGCVFLLTARMIAERLISQQFVKRKRWFINLLFSTMFRTSLAQSTIAKEMMVDCVYESKTTAFFI